MSLQPPPITPRQLNLLRTVASMAWADGHLAMEEVNLMLDRFSKLFATDTGHPERLKQELRDYVLQNVPLEELIPKLESVEERELVLRLGYEVICSSTRTPTEAKINEEEAVAYQHLVRLLNLPPDVVTRIEAEANTSLEQSQNKVDALINRLEKFLRG